MKKLTKLCLLILSIFVSDGYAQNIREPFILPTDTNGKPFQISLPVEGYKNGIFISTTTVSFNTTCGNVREVVQICFDPSDADIFVRANGSGVPSPTTTITNGSDWTKNPTCREVGSPTGTYYAYTVSGTPFTHFAVWSANTNHKVTYSCFGR